MPARLPHTPRCSDDDCSARGDLPGRRDADARLRRRASWTDLVLQEADSRWGPPEAYPGVLPGGRGARDARLEYGPERVHAARVQLGALETGCSHEAPPAPGTCRDEQTAAVPWPWGASRGAAYSRHARHVQLGMVCMVWRSERPPDSWSHHGCVGQSCAGWYAGHREERLSASEQRRVRDTGLWHRRQACAPTPGRIALQGRVAYAYRPHVRIPHGRARAP
jgi:hypothetical protein